ncbi:hypothetical protein B0H14DRAFT_3437654 [Mycena olivaceomarginata]|nr:hypothetical protein B0H14DRAFT_3437654 [Mycena olivaceomarginata]
MPPRPHIIPPLHWPWPTPLLLPLALPARPIPLVYFRPTPFKIPCSQLTFNSHSDFTGNHADQGAVHQHHLSSATPTSTRHSSLAANPSGIPPPLLPPHRFDPRLRRHARHVPSLLAAASTLCARPVRSPRSRRFHLLPQHLSLRSSNLWMLESVQDFAR